ncbi:MAG: hypothetical protein ABIP94_07240 [Planctomycetota bacterium]
MIGRVLQVGALLLVTLGHAQEVPATTPLLRVTSNEARWVEPFAQVLGLSMPTLASGEQLLLSVVAAKPATLSTSATPFRTRTLVVEVRAEAWLQQEAEPVRTAERQLTVRAEALAKLAGLPVAAVRSLCHQLFATAHSLESVVAVVTQVSEGRSYDVRLELVPDADSATASWLGAIAPDATAPARLAWPDAAVRLAFAVQPDSLVKVCEPFLPLVVAFTARGSDPTVAEAEGRALLPLLDGSFYLSLQAGRLGLVYGLRSAEQFAARATDPARLARQREDLASQRIEAEFAPAALTHRDVPLLRSRVRGDTPVPGLADGDGYVTAYGARVGNLWLQIGGGEDPRDSMKVAIDDALDGRLRRPSATSPANAEPAWLTCEVDLVRLGVMTASIVDAEANTKDAPSRIQPSRIQPSRVQPSRVQLSLSSSPHTLKALIQLR